MSQLTLTGAGPSGVGAAGNGLLNALIAYWPGNEANGNALDVHTNALHLTDVNTVTSNPGKVYALARQYTRGNSEYHKRPGDDALLSAGNSDLTIATWIYFDSKPGNLSFVGKMFTVNQYEYLLRYRGATDRLELVYSQDGATLFALTANTHGSPALTQWIFVLFCHDSVNDMVNFQINNGAIESAGLVGGLHDGTDSFTIGAGSAAYFDGRIGPTMFWKSAPGGGGVLTAAQRTALYNGGAGLPYASFTL